MKVVKLETYTIFILIVASVFVGAIFLERYYSTQAANDKLTQITQCNTELQNWQTRMAQDPNAADFTNIKVYKIAYSQTHADCMVATYAIIPAHSSAGADTEWLEIDSLGKQGITYWFDTYSPMPYASTTEILDSQLSVLY